MGLQLQLAHILRTEEARPRTPDRTRLPAAQPALPHRQIFHEGNQRMHRGHRTSQLFHIYHSGSHLRILANETGPRIAASDGFHHSEPGPISLDHLTHGVTRLPRKFPKTDGTSSTRVEPHPHIHQRRADPHRHTRATLRSAGASFTTATSASPQNQPGQMSIRRSTSLLPGIHLNS